MSLCQWIWQMKSLGSLRGTDYGNGHKGTLKNFNSAMCQSNCVWNYKSLQTEDSKSIWHIGTVYILLYTNTTYICMYTYAYNIRVYIYNIYVYIIYIVKCFRRGSINQFCTNSRKSKQRQLFWSLFYESSVSLSREKQGKKCINSCLARVNALWILAHQI